MPGEDDAWRGSNCATTGGDDVSSLRAARLFFLVFQPVRRNQIQGVVVVEVCSRPSRAARLAEVRVNYWTLGRCLLLIVLRVTMMLPGRPLSL